MLKKSLVSLAVVFSLSQITACSSDDDKIEFLATDIQLSVNDITENQAGAVVGTLVLSNTDDVTLGETTVDDERFEIVDNQLKLKDAVALNYEMASSVDLTLTVAYNQTESHNLALNVPVIDVLDTYSFVSSGSDESSVSYSGQTARHILISELNNYIASDLMTDLQNGTLTTSEQVYDKLMSFYETTDSDYDLSLGEQVLTTTTTPGSKQNTLKDISSSTKDLNGKIAGNDSTGQHQDWSTEFVAFGAKGTESPEELIKDLITEIADNAEVYLNGATRNDPLNNEISQIYVTSTGLDLKQLIQKTLLGAVAFSQGTDDYLDNDIDGKGLNADNSKLVDGKTYTNLEHQYDEGFGYFGAARDYLDYSDAEIASKGGRDDWQGYHDTNGDGEIDFKSEYNFGHSTNAAKRDLGTADNTAATDFTALAMNAFLQGRKIITDANATALTETQMTELLAQRDIAVANWEKSIAATAVHYINDVTGDYDAWGTDGFSFSDLAKHWSELKGFLISLQFNPHSPLTTEQLIEINTLIGDKPVLSNDDAIADYLGELAMARTKLAEAYEFDATNVENW